jgi:SAM-dependent methyltransferase
LKDPKGEDLGLGLLPGADHYRAFVGPPEDYDLIAAMSFALLTALGLRQGHALLDLGCGSLRVGRLLIPYLNRAGYTGFEPNGWLVEDGIRNECGADLIELKKPRFVIADGPEGLGAAGPFDFVLAQSIFSHMGVDLISMWLRALAPRLGSSGALVATFLEAEDDDSRSGWVYPECVAYRASTIERIAAENGLSFKLLGWRHPRQTWALFHPPGHRFESLDGQDVSWNAAFDAGFWRDLPSR